MTRLTFASPALFTLQEELDFLEQAGAAATAEVRRRRATLLHQADRFEDAIATLQGLPRDAGTLTLMAQAHLAFETPDHDAAAHVILREACKPDAAAETQAAHMALLARVLIRQGEDREAERVLDQALALDPASPSAFKEFTKLHRQRGRADLILERAEALMDRGVLHGRVQMGRLIALAMLGRIDAAREALGGGRFPWSRMVTPPPGWPALDDFNRELAEEIAAHPGARYGHYGKAAVSTWRVETPLLRRSRLLPGLQTLLAAEIGRCLAENPDPARPPPDNLRVDYWAVVTHAEGHEQWHAHPNAWMSGVYYVEVPEGVVSGTGQAGCLEFGLDPEITGEGPARAFGSTLVRPRPGLITLFPSHAWHRTHPHQREERRVAVAFDLVPEAVA